MWDTEFILLQPSGNAILDEVKETNSNFGKILFFAVKIVKMVSFKNYSLKSQHHSKRAHGCIF